MSSYHFLIIILAIVDSLACLLACLTTHYFSLPIWTLGILGCKILSLFYSVYPMTSCWVLLLISYERYRTIIQPFKPRISKRKYCTACIFLWLLACAANMAIMVTYDLVIMPNGDVQCTNTGKTLQKLISYSVLDLIDSVIPVILMVWFYRKIKHQMDVNELSNNFSLSNISWQRNRIALKTIKGLNLVYIIAVLPTRVISKLGIALHYYLEDSQPLFGLTLKSYIFILYGVVFATFYLNNIMNVFVYARLISGFQRFLINIFTFGILNCRNNV